jgi:hypothetical protein
VYVSKDELKTFGAGYQVPESGVYRVVHSEHREPHFVTAIKGEIFPPCRKCRDRVRYSLALASEYVVYDWDLSGPLFDKTG